MRMRASPSTDTYKSKSSLTELHPLDEPKEARERQSGALPFEQLSGYKVLGILARCGQGAVYRGVDTQGQRVVLKQHFDEARYHKERRAYQLIGYHPNIARYRGSFDHECVIVLEHIDGKGLDSVELRMCQPDVLLLAEDMLKALAAIHRQEIVHRDVKPANMMVTEQCNGAPHFVLLDLGIALFFGQSYNQQERHTIAGQLIGTPSYMSPEQLTGDVDTRSDLYSLGIVLWEALIGELMIDSNAAKDSGSQVPPQLVELSLHKQNPMICGWYREKEKLLKKRLKADDPNHWRTLYDFVLKLTHPDREQRFQSADEALQTLREGRVRSRLQDTQLLQSLATRRVYHSGNTDAFSHHSDSARGDIVTPQPHALHSVAREPEQLLEAKSLSRHAEHTSRSLQTSQPEQAQQPRYVEQPLSETAYDPDLAAKESEWMRLSRSPTLQTLLRLVPLAWVIFAGGCRWLLDQTRYWTRRQRAVAVIVLMLLCFTAAYLYYQALGCTFKGGWEFKCEPDARKAPPNRRSQAPTPPSDPAPIDPDGKPLPNIHGYDDE